MSWNQIGRRVDSRRVDEADDFFANTPETGDGFAMQIFPLFSVGSSQGQGSSITVPEVTGSELWRLMESKFQALQEPPGLQGAPKLGQRHDNPDLFDLYLLVVGTSDHYESGYTYSLPRIGTFELQEFEQFPHAYADCERRIDEFIRCLLSGELKRSRHDG